MGEECSSSRPPSDKEPSKDANVQIEGAPTSSKVDEEELERLAVEALMEEARLGRRRAEQMGAMGWKKRDQTNKRFLSSTLASAVSSNNRKRARSEEEHYHKSEVVTTRRDRTRRDSSHRSSRKRDEKERW